MKEKIRPHPIALHDFSVAISGPVGRSFYSDPKRPFLILIAVGQSVPWAEGFPFSMVPHPQYTGTALSIWGLFLLTRFPHPDWLALPILATIYYAFNAWFERKEPEARPGRV